MLQRTFGLALVAVFCLGTWGFGQEAKSEKERSGDTKAVEATSGDSGGASSGGSGGGTTAATPAHAAILKDSKSYSGLLTVHQKGTSLYGELQGSDFSSEFIVVISIARGIGQAPLLGGFSWGFGDEWVWQFRKIDDKVLVIRKNVRFKAKKNTPEATAVKHAYTDSVLFSLPIIAKGPKGGDLVDLTQIFMSDLPQFSRLLPGFSFAQSKSTWEAIKAFKNNVELEVAATYASQGMLDLDTVADSRGVTLNIHYSISKVPDSSYSPRVADDRIGYFLTVAKDYSKNSQQDHFVRYVNRWKLEKADSSAEMSPPKEPIIFWMEKTVPFKYRAAIRSGIEEWNKAFEKAGFVNAIEVRQQPDDAEWDPEDITYNTFRWITSSAGFAMGPSRVNPYTGQILDADIIFDADFLQFWKEEFETLTQQSIAQMTGDFSDPEKPLVNGGLLRLAQPPHCALSSGMSSQFAMGMAALMARGDVGADAKAVAQAQEKMIMQGLKEVTMHEVGHTLGLRHNFKASKLRTLKEINDPAKANDPSVSSVMDYVPANIVPKGWHQGDFFPTTIGPYDVWAIEYGYKPLSGGTDGEVAELQKIAARSGEPALQYATDEDTSPSDPDPTVNRFDLGGDSLEFARARAELVKEIIPGVVERMTKDGDDYTQARRAFNIVLSQQGMSMYFASRHIGGMYTSRSHKGDKDAKPPLTVIDAKQQRDALALLEEYVFSDKPYNFPPEIYNFLASSNWLHWGINRTPQKDFPVHQVVSMWQSRILSQVLSSTTLSRIHDTELKVKPDQDVLTSAELIERLTNVVFKEVDTLKEGNYTNRTPAISSLRRNLQRNYLRQLSNLAMGKTSAPDDCQTVAFAQLKSLERRIGEGLKKAKLDAYSDAHLTETASRIQKVLDARLSLTTP